MPTYIPDENFPSPSEINQHPCITSSRYLNNVEELVLITQCCQDSYNPSLVILDITLIGAFLFTPTLKILSVDGDTTYESNQITAQFALGHFKNPVLPINTNCQTWHGQLVFDMGQVIQNYTSANNIIFKLEMQGRVPQAFGVSFPNQLFDTTYSWNKGVLPTPVSLSYNGGNLGVEFLYEGDRDCSCNIQCVVPSGVSRNLTFCPGETQTIIVAQDPNSTDPYSLLIQLSDSLGNLSELEVQALFNTIPQSPTLTTYSKPRRITISLSNLSENSITISDEAQYQILKYEGNKANFSIWKDWSSIGWSTFIDYDVAQNKEYGYAVRYKGTFGDISKVSSWAIATV